MPTPKKTSRAKPATALASHPKATAQAPDRVSYRFVSLEIEGDAAPVIEALAALLRGER
jgi:hypothetical protein